jgi:hypothetical protein
MQWYYFRSFSSVTGSTHDLARTHRTGEASGLFWNIQVISASSELTDAPTMSHGRVTDQTVYVWLERELLCTIGNSTTSLYYGGVAKTNCFGCFQDFWWSDHCWDLN